MYRICPGPQVDARTVRGDADNVTAEAEVMSLLQVERPYPEGPSRYRPRSR